MERAIASFNQILAQWNTYEAHISEDGAQYGLPNIKKADIKNYLTNQIAFLEEEVKRGRVFDSFDHYAMYSEISVEANVNSFNSWFQNIPGNPSGHIPPIFTTLINWKAQLTQRGLYPPSTFKNFTEEERSSLQELYDKAMSLTVEHNNTVAMQADLTSLRNRATELHTNLEGSVDLLRVRRSETETLAMKISATSGELDDLIIKTKHSLGTVSESIGQLDKKKEDLDLLHEKLGQAAKEAIVHAETIEKTLAAANRTGLAKAFEERRKALKAPMIIWGSAFVASVIGLFFIGMLVILPTLKDVKGAEIYVHLLFELPLTAPLIWLGYFSGSRYSYVEKVREDYAFKEATALSFEGFKTETMGADKDLLSQLLTVSIENFGQNPIRLYDKKTAISPAADVLNSELAKSITEKISDKIPTLEKLTEYLQKFNDKK